MGVLGKIKQAGFFCFVMLTLGISHSVMADDTELVDSLLDEGCFPRANLIFIIDNSTSMDDEDGTGVTRLARVQAAMTTILDEITNINVGVMTLMREDESSNVFIPVKRLDDASASDPSITHRQYLKNRINSFDFESGTPLVDSLYVAYRIYSGMSNLYLPGGGTHTSPITLPEHDENVIVLLTDGSPSENEAVSLIQGEIGKTCAPAAADDEDGDAVCGLEIVKHMVSQDVSAQPGMQSIRVHTIGFEHNDLWLKSLAKAGNGFYATTDSTKGLVTAFEKAIKEIKNNITGVTFSTPGISVNPFSELSHGSDIYYTLFNSALGPHWPGNVKRYGVSDTGMIVDKKNKPAIDPDTGLFKETAQSHWSSTVDGGDTLKGGAAEQLPTPVNRKIYSDIGSDPKTITSAGNLFLETNTTLIDKIKGFGGGRSDTFAKNLVNWTRGSKVTAEDGLEKPGLQLSDALHSTPVIITYGGTEANPEKVVYYADNAGFFRGLDGKTGKEDFAYIPEGLIENLDIRYRAEATDPLTYGLDGPISAWIKDVDKDVKIQSAKGDHVYLYVTMRRGGRDLYALDLTKRKQPKRMWVIRGGAGKFLKLGQTWSRAVKTKIRLGSAVREVLLFGGGYDPNQDNAETTDTDSMGNAIYIVDAITGDYIWSAGPSGEKLNLPDMKYSIPSEVRAIDVNQDGIMDQFFVGDMGGQVWRFYVNYGASANKLVEGRVVARLGDYANRSERRRFYNPADISVLNEEGERKIALAIGSGYRAHPLDKETKDRFHMLFFDDVTVKSTNTKVITPADLYDATQDTISTGSAADKEAALKDLQSKSGWYMNLTLDGEKVLASSTTADEIVYFTTYTPKTAVACEETGINGRVYGVRVSDAGAAFVKDVALPNNVVRSKELQSSTIPPAPLIMTITDSKGNRKNVNCVATECQEMPFYESVNSTYWIME